MKELYNKKSRHGLKISKHPYDDRSQDMILNIGMPVIAKCNKDSLQIYNNQRYVITKIDNNNNIVVVENEHGSKDIIFEDFNKFFIPGYAISTHCSQGLSICENYTIHEFDKMDIKLRYVALTRAKNLQQIHIMI